MVATRQRKRVATRTRTRARARTRFRGRSRNIAEEKINETCICGSGRLFVECCGA